MNIFKRVRPSNLVLFAAAPFIIYLFIENNNYRRSLHAIIGIEANSGALFSGYLMLLALTAGAIFGLLFATAPPGGWKRMVGQAGLLLHAILLVFLLLQPHQISPFLNSAVANSVDPFESTWVMPTVRPRMLTAESLAWVEQLFQQVLWIYAALSVLAILLLFGSKIILAKRAVQAALAVNFIVAGYLLFVVHAGFASGLFITLRAAIFAYLAAAILGLGWAGLQGLGVGPRSYMKLTVLTAILAAGSLFFFLQPTQTYVLAGALDKRVAIVKGTPQSLSDTIRYGEYDGAEHEAVKIRSVASVEDALKAVQNGSSVSAVFVPLGTELGALPVLWEVTFLPTRSRLPAMSLAVLAFLLGLMTFSGWQHGKHPLAVGAEFFIDTIRGIPMLVIILYVGLPLSGAVKDASAGVIDLPNFTRGIVAISIGYSAYMAEIFRAGIEAIPRGQIEAAQSMGLSRWQVARLVILPQALRIVIPPLGNEFIAMLKDSSLLSILSIRDITQRMREFQAASFLPFAPFNTAAILYVALTLASASMLKWIERRYERNAH